MIAKPTELMNVVKSLKLYSRHDLKFRSDESDDAIERLYCDPREHGITLTQLLSPGLSFLMGRRGTGKSTIFDRAQHELRKSGNQLGCYINLKDILEDSKENMPSLPPKAAEAGIFIEQELWNKYAIKGALIQAIIKELGEELRKRASDDIWAELWRKLTGHKTSALLEKLEEVRRRLEEPDFTDLTVLKEVASEYQNKAQNSSKDSAGLKGSASKKGVEGETSVGSEHARSAERLLNEKFKTIFVRVFRIREMLSEIKNALTHYGINDLFLFFDDYSELSTSEAQFFTDVILQPLHQWDGFLKMKVAVYPNRIRWGKLDPTKVTTIHLDWHEMYGDAGDIAKKESMGAQFVQRLIESRLQHYTEIKSNDIFDLDSFSLETYYQDLFEASNGVPRILGFLLQYLVENRLLKERLIDRASIRSAAERHYEDQILTQLEMDRYRDTSYETRLQHRAQYKILEDFVTRSRLRASELRKGSYEQYKDLKNPPTSHLHFKEKYEQYFDFLELGFFISKQRSAQSKDKNKSSIYALNYGLCVANNISYGRPLGRAFRSYQVETIFNVNDLIESHLEHYKEIVCKHCDARFSFEKLENLQMFEMMCPTCRIPDACEIRTFIVEDDLLLDGIDDDDRLPAIELALIQSLSQEDDPMYSVELAAEVDCSYQKAGARARKLSGKGLLHSAQEDRGRGSYWYFSVAEKAQKYLQRAYNPLIGKD